MNSEEARLSGTRPRLTMYSAFDSFDRLAVAAQAPHSSPDGRSQVAGADPLAVCVPTSGPAAVKLISKGLTSGLPEASDAS
jgi:hypothetical protein